MNKLLLYAIENNASDIHITANKDCWIRINGVFKKYERVIKITEIDEFVELIVPSVNEKYVNMREKRYIYPIDCAFKYMGRRFRANMYLGVDGINMALRLLRDKISSVEELLLPKETEMFSDIRSGLFIVVGTTGSGKSTTLAAIIDKINKTRSENILTIEEPVEYIHTPCKSRIEQIEVGEHIDSFDRATVAAMRQNPNVILVGEMRDIDTMQNVITLAKTGHAVYATLHAKSVTDTIDRIIDVFPHEQQEQMRIQLASVLRGVLHQTLLKNRCGGMLPLVEQLVIDDVTASMITSGQKSNNIRDTMRSRSALGNVHIADNAIWHIQNGRLNIEDVKPYLSSADYAIVNSVIPNKEVRGDFRG